MAAVEVPQTLEYKGGQLNVAPVLEVENFTNWKKRFMCHIVGIEPQFENIILNRPYILMSVGQRNPETQWTPEERKVVNLDQRLKSLIMFVLPDDQMNSVINCLTAKSTWDDLILYMRGPLIYKALMNELVNDGIKISKLEINTGFINSIYDTNKEKTLVPATPLSTTFFSTSIVQDSQDSPDDEEDTRSSQEYMNDLEEEYQARTLLAKSKRFFKKGKKGLIAESYDWDEEEVSFDDNEVPEVKALMALADEERVSVSKESVRNGEWIKISMKKVHTLLEMKDNDDTKSFLDYMCIDLNYVEEQRNNLVSKHRNLVQELNTCKEQLLVLKQLKLDLLTMHHYISEQIPTQKKKILGIDQLTKDTSSSRPKDPVFVKSLADNSEVSITGSNKPKLSEAEDPSMTNHDTTTDYDSANKSSFCSTPFPPLEKLSGAEPVFRPKTIKSILKSKSTFKAKTLKGITINKPSSAPARGNKSSSVSKTNSAPAGKLKNVKIEDDPLLVIVIKELNELKLQISKNKSSYFRNKNSQQYHTDQGESSSRSRPAIPFPSCIHCEYNDHKYDDCVYYLICEIYGSYDHDTHGHNKIISLRRGIKPRNPQHVTKTVKHVVAMFIPYLITITLSGSGKEKLFKLRKLSLLKQCNIKKSLSRLNNCRSKHTLPAQIWDVSEPEGMYGNHYTYITKGYGYGIVIKNGGKVNVPQHEH
ncbi:hypothetical protein Tco_0438020 [Tanacetum coccineum]